MLSHWLLMVVLNVCIVFGNVEHRRVIRQSGSGSCTTTDNETGTCINIKSCPALLDLLTTRGREPSIAALLRKSQCGMENDTPKVCCAITGPSIGSTTRSTRTESTQRTQVTQNRITTTRSPTGENTDFSSTQRTQVTQNRITATRSPTGENTDFSQCGKTNYTGSKITSGKNATLGDWPWIVALGYRTETNPNTQFKCGASLISNRWIVTAAHCVRDIRNLVLTTARLGALDLNNDGEDSANHVDIPVDKIIPHPDYSPSPITNDIALIRLKDQVTFTKLIRPICMLSTTEHKSNGFYSRKLPFIIGWGATEWRGPTTNMLQEAQIEIIDNDNCAQNYINQSTAVIDQRVLCAGQGGKDACQGDSGGPLIIPIGNTYYLAGIVSYGLKCADPKYPGVYTRVAQFADWITRTAEL